MHTIHVDLLMSLTYLRIQRVRAVDRRMVITTRVQT